MNVTINVKIKIEDVIQAAKDDKIIEFISNMLSSKGDPDLLAIALEDFHQTAANYLVKKERYEELGLINLRFIKAKESL